MGSRIVLSLGTVVALATAFAPRAEAQARNPITVCRNGARMNSEDSHVCDRSGGIDLRTTAIARRDAEVRAQQSAQNTNGDDRYGRNNNGTYNGNSGHNNNGRWDNHDNGRRGNGNNGRYSNAPREVFRWQGTVDKEVRIQLQGGRSYIQPIGNHEVRNGNGQMLSNGLPHQDGILRVERVEGRGDIDVIQQPTASNGYQATLRVRDPSSGASNYRIVAVWQPLNNNGQYGRN